MVAKRMLGVFYALELVLAVAYLLLMAYVLIAG